MTLTATKLYSGLDLVLLMYRPVGTRYVAEFRSVVLGTPSDVIIVLSRSLRDCW